MGFLGGGLAVEDNWVSAPRQWGGFAPVSGTVQSPASNISHRTRWTTQYFSVYKSFLLLWVLIFRTYQLTKIFNKEIHMGLTSDPSMHLQYRCHTDPGSTCQWNLISPIELHELSSTYWWHYTGNPAPTVSLSLIKIPHSTQLCLTLTKSSISGSLSWKTSADMMSGPTVCFVFFLPQKS